LAFELVSLITNHYQWKRRGRWGWGWRRGWWQGFPLGHLHLQKLWV